MTTSMTTARDNRQSVQLFDVDLFRNKLENYMRKQVTEMCDMVNTKKRRFSERWSDTEKENMELAEDYRDDAVCYQFGKRQRGHSYYPIDDDEIEHDEVSPLVLPSPVTVRCGDTPSFSNFHHYTPQSYFDPQPNSSASHGADPMSMAMRRQLSGYSEVSPRRSPTYLNDNDDSWMSPCPPLSRGSLSHSTSISTASSMPDTPRNGPSSDAGSDNEEFTTTSEDGIEQSDALHLDLDLDLDLDITTMAPHERNLLAALAPERFEKAALIKRAFRQSDKVLDRFARETSSAGMAEEALVPMEMDDGEYDVVFGQLMQL